MTQEDQHPSVGAGGSITITRTYDGTPCVTVAEMTRYLRAVSLTGFELADDPHVGVREVAACLAFDADMLDCRAIEASRGQR